MVRYIRTQRRKKAAEMLGFNDIQVNAGVEILDALTDKHTTSTAIDMLHNVLTYSAMDTDIRSALMKEILTKYFEMLTDRFMP